MTESIITAWQSILSNKVRSLLTVLGVVIGVASVTTLISLGQGLKNDVTGLIADFGTNVITVVAGDFIGEGESSTNPAAFVSGDILTLQDVETIEKLDQIEAVSPLSLVAGQLKYADKTSSPTIVGVYPNMTSIIDILNIENGAMFESNASGDVVVIGPSVAQRLFGQTNPVGQQVELMDRQMKVIGVLAPSQSSALFNSDFDTMTLLPFDTATSLNKSQVKIFRIVAKASPQSDVAAVKQSVENRLLDNHRGQKDFSVLTQDDLLELLNGVVGLATTLVSAIASISLIVGGIGIMNIMLVTVTERTREIGLRKAVGATKRAILSQFLIEAIMITLVGAAIGLAISLVISWIIALKTDLTPAITPLVVAIAAGISVIIGVVFGLWPAMRAASKDPIEALRYE